MIARPSGIFRLSRVLSRTAGVPLPRLGVGGLLAAVALLTAACSSSEVTTPPRSATEQLLISRAADQAADRLAESLGVTGKVYLDDSAVEGYDSKYAVSAIRDALLKGGARLVPVRSDADTVVELRVGALSVDSENSLIGIPSIGLPLPLAEGAETPEIALFKKDLRQGVAKIAAIAYDRETGALVASTGPQYGFSNKAEWVLLLLFSWETGDLLPPDTRPEPAPWDD